MLSSCVDVVRRTPPSSPDNTEGSGGDGGEAVNVVLRCVCTPGQVCVHLYRVGQTSKLLNLSEGVNKTEKMGETWTDKNSYRENEALSDVFSREIFYVTVESSQWNYC